MRSLESKIENDFVNKLRRWGLESNLKLLIWKISPLGIRGLPDRIIMWPGRGILFIEFKRPGEQSRKIQEYVHHQLTELGFDVEVHDDANVALESTKNRIVSHLASPAFPVLSRSGSFGCHQTAPRQQDSSGRTGGL